MSAAEQALTDAEWECVTEQDMERAGVCIGSGLGGIQEYALADNIMSSKGYRRMSPYYLPKLLVNLAAGQVSIAHNLQGSSLLHTYLTHITHPRVFTDGMWL